MPLSFFHLSTLSWQTMSPTVPERNAPSTVGESWSVLSTVSLAQWSMPKATPLKSFLFSSWESR
eukprot:82256-Heterocapsa_arctica.AAC.1